jgi:pyruvate/2-oxoglutarate/acetoin dehydrogenase E1 component
MTTRIRYADAIVEALRMEMHRDPSIVLIGNGAAAQGLESAFGSDRCVAVAPADEGRVAIAAGAAARGLRPVVEVPLTTLGPALIADLAAAVAAGEPAEDAAPMVVRVPFGTGIPSASRRALMALLGVDGLAVVVPATPADAKGMLSGALHGTEAVCVLEHDALEGFVDGVPEGGHTVPAGSARIAVSGSRVTVIAAGPAALVVEEVASARAGEVTALDLRSVRPLDRETILDCVRGTGKVMIVEDAGCPATADAVTAIIVGDAFEYLDGPVRRVELNGSGVGESGARSAARESIEAACDELIAY